MYHSFSWRKTWLQLYGRAQLIKKYWNSRRRRWTSTPGESCRPFAYTLATPVDASQHAQLPDCVYQYAATPVNARQRPSTQVNAGRQVSTGVCFLEGGSSTRFEAIQQRFSDAREEGFLSARQCSSKELKIFFSSHFCVSLCDRNLRSWFFILPRDIRMKVQFG